MNNKTINDYISKKWDDLTRNARSGIKESVHDWIDLAKNSSDGHLDDTDNKNPRILYLPNDFVTPGGRFSVQFYWDSYFIILALLKVNKLSLAKGMIENMFHLIEKNGYVTANRKRWAAGSQLPFLADMVYAFYKTTNDTAWLECALLNIVQERKYWCSAPHISLGNLSRYHCPTAFPQESWADITLDNEATWDLSSRFDHDVLDILPIDLNANLWMYEQRIIHFLVELNRGSEINGWEEESSRRIKLINEYFWDDQDGLFYDFNVGKMERKKIRSLASYFTMYFEIADARQAERMVDNLSLFETGYGLSTCDRNYGYTDRQWNYPVGWAPLHWIVCKGLLNYGYTEAAQRIAKKWNGLVRSEWEKTGVVYEKYNVVEGNHTISEDTRYENQTGFGWTNSVYLLLEEEILKDE